jgi:diguanylate cyclase (GGDEF)-like protein
MIQLDIVTLLFLYTATVIACGLAVLWLHWNTRPQRGILTLAGGFFAIGLGCLFATFGEQSLLPTWMWTNASFYLGALGYATVVVGIRLMDRPATWYHFGLAVLVTLMAGFLVVTGRWADNQLRASLFHGSAGLASLLVAFELWASRHRDPLPTKGLFAITEVVAAAVFLTEIAVIWVSPAYLKYLAWGFAAEILLNFFTGLFVYSLVKEKTEAALRVSAETDPLTGIGNRRWFFARVPEVCAEGDVVLMVDADHFKSVNDRYGHQTGDLALLFLVDRVRSVLRNGEVFARFGGEEFALFLRKTTDEGALGIAERLRAAVEGNPFVHDGAVLALTISVGVSVARAGVTIDAALVAADHALYRAKAEGRNRVCLGGLGAGPQARG